MAGKENGVYTCVITLAVTHVANSSSNQYETEWLETSISSYVSL